MQTFIIIFNTRLHTVSHNLILCAYLWKTNPDAVAIQLLIEFLFIFLFFLFFRCEIHLSHFIYFSYLVLPAKQTKKNMLII